MYQEIFTQNGGFEDVDRSKVSGNFRELFAVTGRGRRVEVFCIGDSLAAQNGTFSGISSVFWAMTLYCLAITFKARGRRGVGTSVSGPARSDGNPAFGMTSEERMAGDEAAIRQSVAEGFAPVAIDFIQTNDFYATDNGQDGQMSTVANVEKWFLRMLAAGLSHLVINSGGPFATEATLRTRGIVNAYRALAEKYRGLITLVDNSVLLAEHTAEYKALGGQFEYGATMYDPPKSAGGNQGLHPSARGAFLMGKYTLGPALLKLVGQRSRLVGGLWDRYDPLLNIRGPLMADQTRYGGRQIDIGNALSGTQAVTQRDVPDPIWADMGRPDITARELTFTGTPSADGGLKFGQGRNVGPDFYNPKLIPFMPEANIYVDLTNVTTPRYEWVGEAIGGGGPDDCDVIPHLEGLMCMSPGEPRLMPAGDTNFGSRSHEISIGWIAGKPVEGKLIVISASEYPQPPLPAATA